MNAPPALVTPPPLAAGRRRIERPYPGLRPFLDGEESLLFGRERQVRDVIERLRATQFVAVIGGSGSGKSSLILAGVVPELRSFGIPQAGDFWVPLVSTPGTNATPEDQQQRLNTPITRLARKFAALLRSRGSPEADAERLHDIAERLRGERGLARLVRTYSAELQAPPGPDPESACFLFVIDQFEELFHPTTRMSEDSGLLIERVIDHFFSPHERCYVVLTMRSEHLNDCAGFLELPDAINKASYLVRRLDTEQLRTAITGPAQRLLRLRERADEDGARLPESVSFDAAVVERLLADTRRLDANPDHLPLLQHALARLWDAALARVHERLDLPDRIVTEDLRRAVAACPHGAASGPPELPDDANVLTLCLEQWAEAAYAGHGPEGRAQLDRLLPRLGVKDPNTGMYSQERIDVDEAARLLALPGGREELRALLRRGFIGTMDYLFWDEAEPDHVTVKVSHESFIRGWARLRRTMDSEAERFAAFVELLRKADLWQRENRPTAGLLEAGDLRRADEARLPSLLADRAERSRWFRRLHSTNAYAQLASADAAVDDFVGQSRERQLRQRRGEKQRRWFRIGMVVLGVLALPPLAYWTLVQGPVIERTALMFRAGTLAGAVPQQKLQAEVGSEVRTLESLLRAVVLLDHGYQGTDAFTRVNRQLIERGGDWWFVRSQAGFVQQVMAGNEPVVNGALSDLLRKWMWRGDPRHTGDSSSEIGRAEQQRASCEVIRNLGADATAGAALPATSALVSPAADELRRESRGTLRSFTQEGTLITARNPSLPASAAFARAARGIFVPQLAAGDERLEIRAATVTADGVCRSRQVVHPIPRGMEPRVAFDANLRNLFFVTTESGRKFGTVIEIDWERPSGDNDYAINPLKGELVLSGPAAVQALESVTSEVDPTWPTVLETHRVTAGRFFKVGTEHWRVVDDLAQRLPAPIDQSAEAAARGGATPGLPLRRLKGPLSPKAGPCALLASALPVAPNAVTVQAFEDPADARYCFIVQSETPDAASRPAASASASTSADQLYRLLVGVYPRPTAAQLGPRGPDAAGPGGAETSEPLPAPIARMPLFGRTRDAATAQWWVGQEGTAYAGWLASLNKDRSDRWRFVAAPWSTCAWWHLGREIYLQQPGAGRDPGVLGNPETCRSR